MSQDKRPIEDGSINGSKMKDLSTDIKFELSALENNQKKKFEALHPFLSTRSIDKFMISLNLADFSIDEWLDWVEKVKLEPPFSKIECFFLRNHVWSDLNLSQLDQVLIILSQDGSGVLCQWFDTIFSPQYFFSGKSDFIQQALFYFVEVMDLIHSHQSLDACVELEPKYHLYSYGMDQLVSLHKVLSTTEAPLFKDQLKLVNTLPNPSSVDYLIEEGCLIICSELLKKPFSDRLLVATHDLSVFLAYQLFYASKEKPHQFLSAYHEVVTFFKSNFKGLDQDDKLLIAKSYWSRFFFKDEPEAIPHASMFLLWAERLKLDLGVEVFLSVFERLDKRSVLDDYLSLMQLLIELEEVVDVYDFLSGDNAVSDLVTDLLQIRREHYQAKFPEKSIEQVIEDFLTPSDFVRFPLSQHELDALIVKYQTVEKVGKERFEDASDKSMDEIIVKLAARFKTDLSLEEKESLSLVALAIIRERVRRHFKLFPYNTQVLTVLALIDENLSQKGKIGQVGTGEGKSIIVCMLATLKALQGCFVDVITSSRQLAIRDQKKFAPFFALFQISSSHICYDHPEQSHFSGQIIYATNYDFEFSMMRDALFNRELRFSQFEGSLLPRRNDVAIVDEADNLFIDVANNSARIATPSPFDYGWTYEFIAGKIQTNGENWVYDEQQCGAILTTLETFRKEHHSNKPKATMDHLKRWIYSAKRAFFELKINQDYVMEWVTDPNEPNAGLQPKISPVDYQNTGRINTNSRWQDGLHEFVEIKHGLRPKKEGLTAAAMSHPAFFSYYEKIFGLTGTIGEEIEREEVHEVYKVGTFDVPRHRPSQRELLPAQIYPNNSRHYQSLFHMAIEHAGKGQPVLILLRTIQDTLDLSNFFREHNVLHQVLNERQAEEEDYIIGRAGVSGVITLATNTAGRGTDILLSHDSKKAGGLHVIFAFYPANLRVEDQGLGRSGRQGQLGTCTLCLDINDSEIISLFPELKEREKLLKDKHFIDKLQAQRTEKIHRESQVRKLRSALDTLQHSLLKEFFVLKKLLYDFSTQFSLDTLADFLMGQLIVNQTTQNAEIQVAQYSELSEEIVAYLKLKLLIEEKSNNKERWVEALDIALTAYQQKFSEKWACFFTELDKDPEKPCSLFLMPEYTLNQMRKFLEFVDTQLSYTLKNTAQDFLNFISDMLGMGNTLWLNPVELEFTPDAHLFKTWHEEFVNMLQTEERQVIEQQQGEVFSNLMSFGASIGFFEREQGQHRPNKLPKTTKEEKSTQRKMDNLQPKNLENEPEKRDIFSNNLSHYEAEREKQLFRLLIDDIDVHLKSQYAQAGRIQCAIGEPLPLADCYTHVAIVKEAAQKEKEEELQEKAEAANEKNESQLGMLDNYEDIHGVKEEIAFETLFDQREGKPINRLLVLGRAGIGKSTFCQKIVHDWGRRELWEGLFDQVFWIKLREITPERFPEKTDQLPYTTAEIIQTLCFGDRVELTPERLSRLHEDHMILYLLDGYDETTHLEKAENAYLKTVLLELMEEAKYQIITSRPYERRELKGADLELEITGFTHQDIDHFIENPFVLYDSTRRESLKLFLQSNPGIKKQCHVPIQLDLITGIWAEEGAVSLSELYQKLTKRLESAYYKKIGIPLDELKRHHKEQAEIRVCALEEIAYVGMMERKVVIPYQVIREAATKEDLLPREIFEYGLLNPLGEVALERRSGMFIHLSYQEFLAATYIIRQWREGNRELLEQFVAEKLYDDTYEMTLIFIAGQMETQEEAIALFEHVSQNKRYWHRLQAKLLLMLNELNLDFMDTVNEQFINFEENKAWLKYPKYRSALTRCQILLERYPKFIHSLVIQLGDVHADQQTRRSAALLLRKVGHSDNHVIAALFTLATNNNVSINSVELTVRILEKSDRLDNHVMDSIILLMLDDLTTSYFERCCASEVLERLGQSDDYVIDALSRIVEDNNAGDKTRGFAAQVLGKLGQSDDQVIDALFTCMVDGPHISKSKAAYAIGELGRSDNYVIDTLISLVEHAKFFEKYKAAEVLGWLGRSDNYVIDALVRLVEASHIDVMAAYCAALALGQLGRSEDRVIDALIRLVEVNSHMASCQYVVEALGQLGQSEDRVIDALSSLVEDSNANYSVRGSASKALGQLGQSDDKVIYALIRLVEDRNAHNQACYAAQALGQLGRSDDKVIDALIRLVEDSNANTQAKYDAAKALEKLGRSEDRVIDALLINLVADGNEKSFEKDAVAQVLGKLGRANDYVIDALSGLVEDNNAGSQTRRFAAQALGDLGQADDKVIDALITFITDSNLHGGCRGTAVTAIKKLARSDDYVIDAIITLMAEDSVTKFERRIAGEALEQLGRSHDQVADALITLVEDSSESRGKRQYAAKALVLLGRSDNYVIDALITVVEDNSSDSFAKEQAADALVKLGISAYEDAHRETLTFNF